MRMNLRFIQKLVDYKLTLHLSYSERVGAAKTVHYNRVFSINEFDYTVN